MPLRCHPAQRKKANRSLEGVELPNCAVEFTEHLSATACLHSSQQICLLSYVDEIVCLRCRQGQTSSDPAGISGDGDDGVLHAVEFISDSVTEGRVTAAPVVIVKLLEWLVLGPWRGGRAPPFDQREQQFVALLQHLDLRRKGSASGGRFLVCT